MDELLEILARDPGFEDGYARKAMLAVFDLMPERRELVAAYRRRLASALNR
jgi:putative thioredoxin